MHKKFKRQNTRVVCKLSYLVIWIKYSFKNLYNLWIGLLFQDLFHCTVASHFSMTYNEQTRWCTFGYAFFSPNQFKIINSDHSLFLFSLVSKSKYENNNRTHRETDPWSLPFTVVSTHSIQVICDQIGHFWWMMSQIWTVIIWYNYVFVKKYERTEEIVLW